MTKHGLRDISGQSNADGSVTIYGVTCTTDNVNGGPMDNGADPNQLVMINDLLSATSLRALRPSPP